MLTFLYGGGSLDKNIIQNCYMYIETHLQDENLSSQQVAQAIGYSKFHLHRAFFQHTGETIAQYIRERRLTISAHQLLYSSKEILQISLEVGFKSQAAFSRAFKEYYQLPPAKFRKNGKVIENFGNGGSKMTEINGWYLSGGSEECYQVELDSKVCNRGKQSAHLFNIKDKIPTGGFGTLMQNFDAANFLGKRMRFSGFVKTKDVEDWCGLWMRLDDQNFEMVGFDNMMDRKISGTNNWNQYSCVLDIPKETAIINIGILLSDKGEIWLDYCQFEEVDLSVPTTDVRQSKMCELPKEPQNLNFEVETLS